MVLCRTELADWAQLSTEAKAMWGVVATRKQAGDGGWGGELKLHPIVKIRTKKVSCRLGQFWSAEHLNVVEVGIL